MREANTKTRNGARELNNRQLARGVKLVLYNITKYSEPAQWPLQNVLLYKIYINELANRETFMFSGERLLPQTIKLWLKRLALVFL